MNWLNKPGRASNLAACVITGLPNMLVLAITGRVLINIDNTHPGIYEARQNIGILLTAGSAVVSALLTALGGLLIWRRLDQAAVESDRPAEN